jgi:hypothetical protein
MSVQYGIELFPRMRLKRDVIFGFVNLWGELLPGSSNLILLSEVERIQTGDKRDAAPPPESKLKKKNTNFVDNVSYHCLM